LTAALPVRTSVTTGRLPDFSAFIGPDQTQRARAWAAFGKLGGSRRYVVENADGVLHIFSGSNWREIAA
jgi:hypothetical protein